MAVCHDDFCEDFLRRCERELRKRLKLQHAVLDEVVALCLRQIKYTEPSCAALKRRLAELPEDAKSRAREIERSVAEACAGAVNSDYVRDCERVARFLSPHTGGAEREEIIGQCRLEHEAWCYPRGTIITNLLTRITTSSLDYNAK